MANRYHRRLCQTTVSATYILLAICLTNTVQHAFAQQSKPLKKGVFLVATNNLKGSSFEKTVIFITHHNDEGSLGLVINRPSSLSISDAFPKLDTGLGFDKIYLGGPVHPESLFILSRDLSDPELDPIIEDVSMGMGDLALSKLFNKKSNTGELRVYMGYSGWTAGQLEFEVNKGDWIIIKPIPDLIFIKDPINIWKELSEIWSGHWI